jgi:hypothetical protein
MPIETNLRWGHHFLQASMVLPLYEQDGQSSSRSIPVRFEMAPVVKKPGRKASPEQWQEYKRQKKKINLSVQFVAMSKEMRQYLNTSGHKEKRVSLVTDGSFCNRTVMKEDWEQLNMSLTARTRKDIVLCKRAPGSGRRFLWQDQVYPADGAPARIPGTLTNTQIYHGGCFREVRYKELTKVYWQRGAKKKELRLLVVAPVGYRTSKNGRKFNRKPAYLLTTDLTTSAAVMLQDYFDRWGIEVNHRDEKEILGLGEAQVWNKNSVTKVPALLVAMYSWLLLAGLHCYGPQRTKDYEPLPKWRRGAKRPSCLDLVTLLRKQLAENPHTFATASAPPTYQTMVGAAAA